MCLIHSLMVGPPWDRMCSRCSRPWIRSFRHRANIVLKSPLHPHTPHLSVATGGRVPRRRDILHHVRICMCDQTAQACARRQSRRGAKGHRQQRISANTETCDSCHSGDDNKLAPVPHWRTKFGAFPAGLLLAAFPYRSMLPGTRFLVEYQKSC